MPAVIVFIVIILYAIFGSGCASSSVDDTGYIAAQFHEVTALDKEGRHAEAMALRRQITTHITKRR